MPLYKIMRISKRKSTSTNLNDKMQSSEDIQHNHNLIECNFKYDINSFLASPSISFDKPTKLNLIVADDHGVDDDSDKNITEKTNNNTNTVKYLNLAIPNCCPYDNDIVNVTTGGDQFINYSNNHNIKCNLNKINLFIISSVNTKIKVNLNSLTLRDEQMTKIGWANDFPRIWPIDFIGGATSVINSSKTETLLGGLSPSVEGLGVLLPPVHMHIQNMQRTTPSHIGSSSRNILTLITLNKNQIPYLVKLMIYKNSDENELAIFNSSNTNVTKILVMNNNDNIMDVDDNFRDNIWIMAVDKLLVASNNYTSVPDNNNDINNNYKINIPAAIINNIDLLQSLDDFKLDVASASQQQQQQQQQAYYNIDTMDNSMMPNWTGYERHQNDGNNMNIHTTISHQKRINDNVDNDDVQCFINEHNMWPAFMLYKQPICKSFTHTNIKPKTISTTITTTTTKTTTTTTTNIMITQSDMNKSEYAFKKTLNSFKSILMDKDSVIIDSDLANQQRIMMHNGRTTNQQQLHEKPDNDLLNKLQQSMITDHIDESDDNNNDKYKNLQKLYKQSGIVFDHNFIKLMNFNKANATNNLKHNNLIKQVISDNKNLNTCDIDEKNDYFNDAKSDEYKNVMKTKQFDDNVNMLQPPLKPKLFLSSSNNYMPFDQLTKIVAREKELVNNYYECVAVDKTDTSSTMASNDRWGIPRMMRLRGGVEQALNNGTTGWGSPPSSSSSTNAGSWGPTSNAQQPPAQQWGATSQQSGNTSQQQPRQPDPNSNNKNPSQQQPGAPAQQQNAQMNPNQQVNVAANSAQQQGNGNNWNTQGQQQPQQPIGGVQPPPNNNSGNPIPGGNNNNVNLAQVAGVVGGGTSTAAAKNQLEQLNTMREALFSQDGWGCQHVNQDSNWDVPGTPEPGMKVDPTAPPVWKPTINNGTELWEANLRNGGQPPPTPVQKTPWGHTPSTNLGGTWGEDDDGSEAGNVWTGAPSANPPAQQWGQPSTGMWPATQTVGAAAGPKKDGDWSGNAASTGNTNAGNVGAAGVVGAGGSGTANNWGDPREMRSGGNPMDLRVDPRELRAPGGTDPRAEACQRDMRMVDPREQMRGDMRGDPRGISGRLNGTSEMWGQHHNLTHGSQMPLNKMGVGPTAGVASTTGQWGGASQVTGPKDLAAMNKPSGWEEPSPPAQRRSMPNFDDGTSLWGQQQAQQSQQPPSQQQPRGGPSNAHWKDMADPQGRNMIRNEIRNAVGQSGPGVGNASTPLPPSRIGPSGPIKTDTPMWGHAGGAGRVNSWDEGHSTNWEDKNAGGGMNVGASGAWDGLPAASWPNKNKQIGAGGQGWQDSDTNEWNNAGVPMPKQQQPYKSNSMLEILRNSRQYQMMVNLGLKKEDIDLALRATNFNLEDATEMLKHSAAGVGMDVWRRHDDHASNAFDHPGFPPKNQYGPTPSMPFPNNNPNLLNNIANAGGNPISNVGNMQPIQAQKYLNQGGHNAGNGSNGNSGGVQGVSGFNQGAGQGNQATGQGSTQHLRMLVQQIQMAVQAGYLNHQILNQPLAPTTLHLLNQLLSNIKQLQMTTTNMNRGGVNSIQMTLTITKLKLAISSLQNQIAAQQAIYVKQQQQGQHGGMGNTGGSTSTSNDYLRGVQHSDSINALQGTFSEMSMNKLQEQGFQTPTTPQSRLNQWKLPTVDALKDGSEVTDFSRAPGTTAKSTMSTSNSTIGSLGLQGDGTWSTGRNLNDGWPDSTQEQEKQDWPPSQPSPATAFTDLVPEFEPGKPWKGSQIKTIEDDPSITPGSVARSPLSIAAKDDLFAPSSKTSPTDLPPLSLSSSTWSFNPTSGSQPNFTSAISKLSSKSNSWSDGAPQQATPTTSELWGAPMSKSARGPPPGLGTNKAGGNGSATGTNGWIGSGLTGRSMSGSSNWAVNNNAGWSSNWLLLKNLTAQIDGSTLRTLCMQHGPLLTFHLYLTHGIALCKYSTREEANKAQMALNNCVLGNTTICAESPSDGEVQSILQHLGVPGASQSQSGAASGSGGTVGSVSGGQSAWRQPTQATPSRSVDTWGSGSVWPSANAASGSGNLWTPLDGATERGTPSSLNSFLPESLLGSELN
ncbi:protein Gawky isoform X3 [Bradysia coprophila]|uniref:protein Gawky isoform X3 n=1 Tax=Bradysia coprophila TaxID=38358 RepID=UPI00187D9B68|nr:protein Gawky isoform X3 [Bradysia coprophila]